MTGGILTENTDYTVDGTIKMVGVSEGAGQFGNNSVEIFNDVTISSGGDTDISGSNDVNISDTEIDSGGDTDITAGEDLNIADTEITTEGDTTITAGDDSKSRQQHRLRGIDGHQCRRGCQHHRLRHQL